MVIVKINRSNVLCVGDLHMGVHKNRLNHLLDLASWFKEIMVSHNLTDIIIPGDIIHTREEVAVPVLDTMSQFFTILKDFNIIITVGNHDCYYNNRSDIHSLTTLNQWENITVIDKPTTYIVFGRKLGFCPWACEKQDIPECDILFGHFDIKTFQMSGKKLSSHGFEPDELLSKSTTVISNHYHGTQKRTYKNGTILYLGSPYEQNWGEVSERKGVYILDIMSGDTQFLENKISPRHIRIRLSELLALGVITDQIKQSITGNIVQFVIDQALSSDDIDALSSTLQTFGPLEFFLHLEYSDKITTSDVELEATGVNIQSDIISFIDTLEIDNKQAVQDYILATLHKVETN